MTLFMLLVTLYVRRWEECNIAVVFVIVHRGGDGGGVGSSSGGSNDGGIYILWISIHHELE